MSGHQRHVPVLLREVIEALEPRDGELYVDATFGAGGYAMAILEAANCKLIGLDRDPNAVSEATGVLAEFEGRLDLLQTPFSAIADVVGKPVDGVVFDLGVSSMQLDEAERGFSFQADGPLDMRMDAGHADDQGVSTVSAADLINTADEATLADILFHYGEERKSRTIARAIVTDRDTRPFTRTSELADLVARVLGRRHNDPKHPATRTFQALRIAVNHEFQEVVAGLSGAERVLKPGGRLVVVTFHSLEDRIVKRWLTARTKQRGGGGSRHQPEKIELQQSSFELINRRPLTPSQAELARNPRSRSAKLRSATRLDTPPILDDGEVLGVKTVDLTRAGTRDSRQGRS